MKELLADLFTSKKAMAALASIATQALVRIAGKYNIVLDPATADQLANAVLMTAGAYLLGQGIADHGKEKAQVEAEAKKTV